jgi:hypothetical protein
MTLNLVSIEAIILISLKRRNFCFYLKDIPVVLKNEYNY